MVLTPDFSPVIPDVMPPCCIDAEEAVLGCLLLDGDSIDLIKHKLKPEHFYISTYRDIYRACLNVSKKSIISLLTVTNYLNDRGTLQKIGGRNKLAQLFESQVSSTNIDNFAALVIEKAIRRQLIELGNKTTQLAYAGEIEIDEIMHIVRQRTEIVTGLEAIQTEEENHRSQFDKLMNQLKDIHTRIVEPDYRLWRLQQLAQNVGKSPKALEELYKS
jgi:replicative DNA helicase